MFVEIKSPEGFRTAFSLLKELRPDLDLKKATLQLKEMVGSGYRMVAFVQEGEMIGLAGFAITANFALGKKMYVEDLVTTASWRSKHVGRQMLKHLEELAEQEGCRAVHLDSGVQRHASHKFFLNNNYQILAHHFVKWL